MKKVYSQLPCWLAGAGSLGAFYFSQAPQITSSRNHTQAQYILRFLFLQLTHLERWRVRGVCGTTGVSLVKGICKDGDLQLHPAKLLFWENGVTRERAAREQQRVLCLHHSPG